MEAPHTLYVGDNFAADYVGAINAAMNAVLIDPTDQYQVSNRLAHLFDLERFLDERERVGKRPFPIPNACYFV